MSYRLASMLWTGECAKCIIMTLHSHHAPWSSWPDKPRMLMSFLWMVHILLLIIAIATVPFVINVVVSRTIGLFSVIDKKEPSHWPSWQASNATPYIAGNFWKYWFDENSSSFAASSPFPITWRTLASVALVVGFLPLPFSHLYNHRVSRLYK